MRTCYQMSGRTVGRIAISVCLILAATLRPSAAQQPIRWDRQSFSIGGKDVVLIGGSMHYFRIPAAEWETDFERMREDGFNLVDVYIPWFIHEPEAGAFNFETLQTFLDLAHKYGLYVVARPGPYINSESDQGAFPRWLSGKNVEFRRDTDLDRKWSKHWYDAIMPVLARNQITRGGPVIMVQIENEYGHPQYLSDDEKKRFLRFLYQTASAYSFDIPLMGNDMQFAQRDPIDPTLSRVYGTADAYFDNYQQLEEILSQQRKLNIDTPLGCAEYGVASAEATLRTMLGLGTDYLDEYLFRGGSQFGYAAKGYEFAGYSADAIVEEGGYTLPKYGPMKATALFLRQFGETLARAEAAPEPATVDDPEVWIKQRNNGEQGFLFLRSDVRGVSERSLSLQSASRQQISYIDPANHQKRTIPQHTRLLLGREQSRLLPLNIPLGQGSTLVYTTADVLGRYSYGDRTWLVLYAGPGETGEAVFRFEHRPGDLNEQALWATDAREAAVLLPFGERDQIVPVTKELSLLLISRERAYRAKEFAVGNEPALLVSDADDALFNQARGAVTFHLQTRHWLGDFTLLSASRLASVRAGDRDVKVAASDGTQRFSTDIPAPDLGPATQPVVVNATTGFKPSIQKWAEQLASLPELEIWKKGVTHYHAGFPGRNQALELSFFTDDYKAVYVNGQFVSEASNRAPDALLLVPCPLESACSLDIYYVDTGRPKEDLGLWRLDEKKGLASADWLDGTKRSPVRTEWQIEFASLKDLASAGQNYSALMTLEYSFPRPDRSAAAAVWRAFMPEARGLVYLNGEYMEHHEPGRTPNIGRDGIYLPPSMLKENNKLLFVALEPVPEHARTAVIRAEPDSIRREAQIILSFAPR